MDKGKIPPGHDRPEEILRNFPVLTKDILRRNFQDLKSRDLDGRKWYFNTSGGSTGEPIRLIQDRQYFDVSTGITMLYSHLAGYETGESIVYIWGSDRDMVQGTMGFRKSMSNYLSNVELLNAFRMTGENMREFIRVLNQKRPRLVIAYAESIYELACFSERESLKVIPQNAIITSAGTLYPFMREKIQSIFRCPVYNRYGSREVGDLACEGPGYEGLWVAPWGSYVEVVDDEFNPVSPGIEGNLLITSLINYAMPLVRYFIGDRGVLYPNNESGTRRPGQVLKRIAGRNVDTFKMRDGKIIPGEFFIHMLGVVLNHGGLIRKFQVVQKNYNHIVLKIVPENQFDPSELVGEIEKFLESPCTVTAEFVEDIPPAPSGKYRYTISEVG